MAWFGTLGRCRDRHGFALQRLRHDRLGLGTPSPGAGPDPATGYTVIEAANLHDAVVLAKGCPGLSGGGSVKLYEAAQMG